MIIEGGNMLIKRLENLNAIQEVEKSYAKKNGDIVINLSTWKVNSEFKNKILQSLSTESFQSNYIDYIYSYNIPEDIGEKVKDKLGVQSKNVVSYFTQNNTISIVYLCNMIRLKSLKSCMIIPSYFSIQNVYQSMNVSLDEKPLLYENGSYSLPGLDEFSQYDVIWVTSPTFSTGVYFDNYNIRILENLLEQNKMIIADESFCSSQNELIRKFYKYENFIGIYSPHKAISVNGLKFSVVLCNKKYEELLEHWADVLGGNLSTSNCNAIYHYVSSNFDKCAKIFNIWIAAANESLIEILNQHPNFTYDKQVVGCMRMIYAKRIPFIYSYDKDFYEKLLENTNCMIYPGAINNFMENYGFSFRINLLLYNKEFKFGFIRVLNFLENLIQ